MSASVSQALWKLTNLEWSQETSRGSSHAPSRLQIQLEETYLASQYYFITQEGGKKAFLLSGEQPSK